MLPDLSLSACDPGPPWLMVSWAPVNFHLVDSNYIFRALTGYTLTYRVKFWQAPFFNKFLVADKINHVGICVHPFEPIFETYYSPDN